MKLLIICVALLGIGVSAEERAKRQAGYAFPGPRNEGGGYNRQAAAGYPSQQQSPASYAEEQDDSDLYQVPRRQFQAQPVQQYAPAQPRAPAQLRAPAPAPPPAPAPVYEAPRPAPRYTNAPAPTNRKKASASTRNKYTSPPQQSLNGAEEEEEEEPGPDALTLLLQDSKFACGGKNDGYYADDSVNCQVFHYCVGGARHSWMCPDGTVFHQVHLNCVPASQDICAQSPKFHFVNDYLYKPLDYEGPNNTARYAQRYYPEGYVVGDPIHAPQDNQGQRRPEPPQQAYNAPPPVQSYPAPAPVARPPPRQVAPPPPPPPPQAPPPSYNPAPSPARAPRPPRPARPARPSYQAEAQQGYRGSQPAPPPPPPPPPQQVSYQPVSQDNSYQPAPPPRRPAPPLRSQGYAPRQHRPSAPAQAPAQYPSYGNQAAGVQYDEDY